MKNVVRASMALVALFAFALSFQSLMALGQFAGYGSLAWMYPLCVDLGAVSSCVAWLATRSRQALGMTWSLLAISVVQNGTVHWLIATHRAPEWWLITLVATVPPIVLGLTAHLAVGLGWGDRDADAGTVDTGLDDQPHDELRVRAVEIIQSRGGQVGRSTLARELDVSEWQARRLLEELGSSGGGVR